MTNRKWAQLSGLCGLALSSSSLMAVELIKNETTTLTLEGESILGAFTSDKGYAPFGDEDGADWLEGYLKIGFAGERKVGGGAIYGKVNIIGSFTGGDGDAAGLTTGSEGDITEEDLFIGFKNDLFDISVGSQNYSIGDGFIINGDALNFGKGFDVTGTSFDRGGAYWLAARKSFDQTVVAKFGREAGPRAEVFYIKSDNPGQASYEFAGLNLEYRADFGTVGLTYIDGVDVNDTEAGIFGTAGRDGQTTTSIRFQGNAGVENLFLSAEYVDQSQGSAGGDDAQAGYAEAAWTFANTPWSPTIGYRFSSYDEGYDPLFNGFSRGYGTWFQGEVAANYAGPFNTNTDTQHLSLKLAPSETLTLGASFFDFSPKEGNALEATEVNLWAEYVAFTPLRPAPIIFSPLIGFFSPENSAADGGSQLGDDDSNLYAQILVIVPF